MQSLEITTSKPPCPRCGSSDFIQKAGYVYAGENKENAIQVFKCRACRRIFRENANKYGTHYPEKVVDFALELLKKQIPIEDIRRELKNKLEVEVSRPSILYWARKFLPASRESTRDTNARVKVVNTIVELIGYEELSRRSGVKQSTIRAMFGRFTMKASFCHSLAAKDYSSIRKRVQILETNISKELLELDSIKGSLAKREEYQNSLAKMIESGSVNFSS